MLLDGTEIDLFATDLEEIIDRIVLRHPKLRGLEKTQLRFSAREEQALDAQAGMMWPCIFALRLQERYRAKGERSGSIAGNVSFIGNDAVLLRFKVNA